MPSGQVCQSCTRSRQKCTFTDVDSNGARRSYLIWLACKRVAAGQQSVSLVPPSYDAATYAVPGWWQEVCRANKVAGNGAMKTAGTGEPARKKPRNTEKGKGKGKGKTTAS